MKARRIIALMALVALAVPVWCEGVKSFAGQAWQYAYNAFFLVAMLVLLAVALGRDALEGRTAEPTNPGRP